MPKSYVCVNYMSCKLKCECHTLSHVNLYFHRNLYNFHTENRVALHVDAHVKMKLYVNKQYHT